MFLCLIDQVCIIVKYYARQKYLSFVVPDSALLVTNKFRIFMSHKTCHFVPHHADAMNLRLSHGISKMNDFIMDFCAVL